MAEYSLIKCLKKGGGMVFFILLMAFPAYAYLDGGTGNMLLQLILGGMAGIIVALKIYWKKLISFFNKRD